MGWQGGKTWHPPAELQVLLWLKPRVYSTANSSSTLSPVPMVAPRLTLVSIKNK